MAMFPAAGSGFRMIDPGENKFSPGLDMPKPPGQQVDRGLSERSGAAAGRCNTSVSIASHRNPPIFQVQVSLCTGSREELPGRELEGGSPQRSPFPSPSRNRSISAAACAAGSALCGAMVCGLADYLWNYPRVMCIFWFVFAIALAGTKLCCSKSADFA